MKSYTNIEQSKVLSEILPHESADMYYPWYIEEDRDNIKSGHRISIPSVGNFIHKVNILPCWSLAALLCVLPKGYSLGRRTTGKYYVCMTHIEHKVSEYDNPVDACYELILKLNELNLL